MKRAEIYDTFINNERLLKASKINKKYLFIYNLTYVTYHLKITCNMFIKKIFSLIKML
jgi:hypothetical protein